MRATFEHLRTMAGCHHFGAAVVLPVLLACTPQQRAAETEPGVLRNELTTGWLEARITPTDDLEEAEFGRSLAIQGQHLLVGAPAAAVDGLVAGVVQVFEKHGSDFVPEARLVPTQPADNLRFGDIVAVSPDFAAVAALAWEPPTSVQIFASLNDDDLVLPDQVIEDPSAQTEPAWFGSALAFSENTLFVGAPAQDGAAVDAGSVYVYARADGHFSQIQALHPSGDAPAGAWFGSSITADADHLFVGAPSEDGAGIVYAFERDDTSDGRWSLAQRVEPPSEGGGSFGRALAVTGERLFVGAPEDATGAGVVCTFEREDGEWQAGPILRREQGEYGDLFGTTLAATDEYLFASAPGAFADDDYSGIVAVFALGDSFGPVTELVTSVTESADFFGQSLAISPLATVLVAANSGVYAYVPDVGSDCSEDGDCRSGHCSEGVCCDEACNAVCRSCRGALTGRGDAGNGQCAPVERGSDPRDDCDSDGTVCGTTGACDGNGACALANQGLPCSEAGCASNGASVGEAICDGSGSCRAPGPVSCRSGYVCSGAECLTECSNEDDCDSANGYYCYETACLAGARCSLDGRVAIDEHGVATDCGATVCREGACLEACRRSAEDCAPEFVCDPYEQTCVPEAILASQAKSTSAGCSLGSAARSSQHVMLLALLVLTRLRKKRRLLLTSYYCDVGPPASACAKPHSG